MQWLNLEWSYVDHVGRSDTVWVKLCGITSVRSAIAAQEVGNHDDGVSLSDTH